MIDRIRTYLLTVAVFGVAILAALLRIKSLKHSQERLQRQRDHYSHQVWTRKQQVAQQQVNQLRKKVVLEQIQRVRDGKAPRDHFE